MTAKVSKVTITIGKRELELSVEDAKALFDGLNQLFGSKYTYTPTYPNGRWWYTYSSTNSSPNTTKTISYCNTDSAVSVTAS